MHAPARLAKRLVELVSCSRREAELYIAGGWVKVDGLVVEEPQFMVDAQKVELHPDATLTPVVPVTILFNQQEASSSSRLAVSQLIRPDTQTVDDGSGVKMLKQHLARLTQIAPLQQNACGLVVFTQDWRVERTLQGDGARIEQEYVVEVSGELASDGLKLLNHGLAFNGRALPPVTVSWQNENRLRFALKGVQAGQIAQMCNRVGLQVLAMKRIRIGQVNMSKLQPGLWRYLLVHERF